MPIPADLLAQFNENDFFHVICKSIYNRKLFLTDDDRRFFLDSYGRLLCPFVDTYSYCLLSNHAHFVTKPKTASDIYQVLINTPPNEITLTQKRFIQFDQMETFHELIEKQFTRLFISHALTFNSKHNQSGHLFQRPFRRKTVTTDDHLTQLMIYIHANPLKHKIVKDFTTYKWSSYQAIISDTPTQLCRNDVLDWFGGRNNFIKTHLEQSWHYYSHPSSIE